MVISNFALIFSNLKKNDSSIRATMVESPSNGLQRCSMQWKGVFFSYKWYDYSQKLPSLVNAEGHVVTWRDHTDDRGTMQIYMYA